MGPRFLSVLGENVFAFNRGAVMANNRRAIFSFKKWLKIHESTLQKK